MISKSHHPATIEDSYLSKIYHYLKRYRSITQWDCYDAGLTSRLSAQIYELKTIYNQPIISLPESRKNRFGGHQIYTRYLYQEDYNKWLSEHPQGTKKEAAAYFKQLSQLLHNQDKSIEELKAEIQYFQTQLNRCTKLLKEKQEPPKPPITSFRGRYAFLNNRYRCLFVLDGTLYPTAELAYLAYHTTDTNLRELIARSSPEEAKKLLFQHGIQTDWKDIKEEAMERILRAKFQQNPALQKQLIATGTRKIQPQNTVHENYWGSCICSECQGLGQNRLGRLLMNERQFEAKEYQKKQKNNFLQFTQGSYSS